MLTLKDILNRYILNRYEQEPVRSEIETVVNNYIRNLLTGDYPWSVPTRDSVNWSKEGF